MCAKAYKLRFGIQVGAHSLGIASCEGCDPQTFHDSTAVDFLGYRSEMSWFLCLSAHAEAAGILCFFWRNVSSLDCF